ncbi:MAG: hypothetical protein LBK13_06930, partial [Spirochaetales bacterium]|nr:hypothetical protein [Spirochaetales bacterium]
MPRRDSDKETHFFARSRAKKPGFAGLRYRSGPACGVAASHPSNPLRAHQRAADQNKAPELPAAIQGAGNCLWQLPAHNQPDAILSGSSELCREIA